MYVCRGGEGLLNFNLIFQKTWVEPGNIFYIKKTELQRGLVIWKFSEYSIK